MSNAKRKPVVCKSGRTLWLSTRQQAFKSNTIKIVKDVMVYGLISNTKLKAGLVMKTSPLYKDHIGTAISGDGTEVHVSLGKNCACWIPEGCWEKVKKSRIKTNKD